MSIEQAKLNAEKMLAIIRKTPFSQKGNLIVKFAQAVAEDTEDKVLREHEV